MLVVTLPFTALIGKMLRYISSFHMSKYIKYFNEFCRIFENFNYFCCIEILRLKILAF